MYKLEIGARLKNLSYTGYITSIDTTRPDGHFYGVHWDGEGFTTWYTQQKVLEYLNEDSIISRVGSFEYKFWVCYSEKYGFEPYTDIKLANDRAEEIAKEGQPAVVLESTNACFPKSVEWVETIDTHF